MTVQNWNDVTNCSTYFRPAHGLPLIPSATLKSLNAICNPYSGPYRNSTP